MSEMNTKHKGQHGVKLIETSTVEDAYGFAYHRLKPDTPQLSPIQRARFMCELFDGGAPAEQIFAVDER
jgi:hypothetical protein